MLGTLGANIHQCAHLIVRLKDTICIYCLLEAGDIVTVHFVFISHCAHLIVRLKDMICIYCLPEAGDIVMHIVKNVS